MVPLVGKLVVEATLMVPCGKDAPFEPAAMVVAIPVKFAGKFDGVVEANPPGVLSDEVPLQQNPKNSYINLKTKTGPALLLPPVNTRLLTNLFAIHFSKIMV